MKFHTSEFFNHDNTPRPWCDFGLNEEETIKKYFWDYVKVYDADECGDERIEFVFENGKAFILEYSWYIEYDPEWSLLDVQTVTEVHLDKIKVAMKKYRDIIGEPHDAGLNKFVV